MTAQDEHQELATAVASPDRPLVVDLDGTLVRSDLLHELASSYVFRSPGATLDMLRWLRQGKAHLKDELAARSDLDVATLPYHAELLDWLRAERATGRRLVLATGGDRRLADEVAAELGLFDEVLASGDGINLTGAVKRAALVERYGEGGFDYVGNHAHDLEVWRYAGTAHVVGNTPRFLGRVRGLAGVGISFPRQPAGGVRAIWRALRPQQWIKNALLVVPLLTAQRIDDPDSVLRTLLALVTFCLAASSVYVLNDLADVGHDRHHPQKRHRPFAAGELGLVTGWLLWPALAILAFTLAAVFLPPVYVGVLAGYLVLTAAYTAWLKRKPVLDVVTLGILYSLRIVAGAAAIDVELSMWLLTFSMFFFLSLALIKRVGELTRIRRTMAKNKGRGYVETDLELLSSYGVASSIASVVIFSLYVNDPKTSVLYETPELLWCSVPVMLAWLMRCWLLAHRGEMNEDPIIFATRDRASLVAGVAIVAAFVAAKVLSL